jgi:RimJ/RimL family protein N-acetyltransferase
MAHINSALHFLTLNMLKLHPIFYTLEENYEFINVPECQEALVPTIEYYRAIGYCPPWIGYFASEDNILVGSAGIKGRPKNNKIEIAYGTFPQHREKGIGTAICRELVLLALQTNPTVIVTARTFEDKNFSARILEKNNFKLLGTVWDEDDGNVWEWQYVPS